MKTQNIYTYPVKITPEVRITYDESPAHVGALIHSVDFITPDGTPIYAAADGKVIEVEADNYQGGDTQGFEQYGNYIEILHNNDEYSEYEHLIPNGVRVKVGDIVKQGDLIGFSGSTGWLAHLGAHLHFMVGMYGATDQDYQTLEITWKPEK